VPAEWPGNPYNRAKPVAGSGRGHVCGTREDFAGDAELDPDADTQYRPDGLPVCCDPVRELAGGMGCGVVATVSVSGDIDLTGTTCPAASPLALEQWYTWTAGTPGVFGHWYYPVPFPGAGNLYLHVSSITGAGAEIDVDSTGGCGAASAPFTQVFTAGVTTCPVLGSLAFFPNARLLAHDGTAHDAAYRWKLSASP
jgi:hypothetical protein